MARFLKGAIALFFVIVLTLFMVRNRAPVTLDFWPLPYEMVDIPLFFVFFAGLLLGVFVAWIMHLVLQARRHLGKKAPSNENKSHDDADQEILDDL